ncbi:MAG: glycosyltransferase family 2 protein [Bacteroidota bacterium]
MKNISFILPVFNEAKNIPLVAEKIAEYASPGKYHIEIIFVDDGSTDESLYLIKKLSEKDKSIKYIALSRNFGQQAALTAGLDMAKGDAVITMDCDFQDPPEIITQMLEKWEEGFKIVYTRRKIRNDGFFKRTTAKTYYKLLYKFSENKIQGNIGDYRLIDKRVLEELGKMRERSRYLRGMIPWLGFDFFVIDYERPKRKHGKTGYGFLKMARLAMNGMLNFSLLPLRFGLMLGIFVIFTGVVFFIYLILNYLINDQFYKLLEWLAVINYILIGFFFVLFWIVAEYIGKIYNESKDRPIYIIKEKGNF